MFVAAQESAGVRLAPKQSNMSRPYRQSYARPERTMDLRSAFLSLQHCRQRLLRQVVTKLTIDRCKFVGNRH